MSREIVDISHLQVVTSRGSVELTTATSFSLTRSDPSSAVKTMNRRRRAIGKTRGVPDFSVDLEVALPKEGLEVDFVELQRTKEEFLIVFERGDDGQRIQLVDCSVDEVSEPYTAEGETRISVKITPLDEQPQPAPGV